MDTLELEVGYELVSLVEAGDLVERIRSLRRQFALDYGFIVSGHSYSRQCAAAARRSTALC